jgi:hypothetical protein
MPSSVIGTVAPEIPDRHPVAGDLVMRWTALAIWLLVLVH